MTQPRALPEANSAPDLIRVPAPDLIRVPAPDLIRGLPHHPEAPDQVRGGVSHRKGATA